MIVAERISPTPSVNISSYLKSVGSESSNTETLVQVRNTMLRTARVWDRLDMALEATMLALVTIPAVATMTLLGFGLLQIGLRLVA